MKSARFALSWEFWSQAKTTPLLALGICISAVSLFYYGFWSTSAQFYDFESAGRFQGTLMILHGILFSSLMPIVVIYVYSAAGVPETRFTLPIATWSLVGWPMLSGCLATGCACLLVAVFANTLFHAEWPLTKPMIAAAVIYAFSHSISWILECGRLRLLISVLCSAILAVATFALHQTAITQDQEPYWQTITIGDMLLAVALLGVAYTAAVGGVSLARRGDPLSLTKLGEFLVDCLDYPLGSRAAFKSARSAQDWFEWTSKGIAIPAVSTFLVLCACLVYSTGWLTPEQTVGVIGVFTYMALMMTPLFGWFLGSAGPKFNIREFIATRPLTDTELADGTLAAAAKSLCWGWAIWWVGSALALGCAWLSGSAPTTPAQFFPLKSPPETWSQVVLYSAVGAGGCLLISWTLISWGVWTVLLRSWLFSWMLGTGLCASIGYVLVSGSASAAAIAFVLLCLLIVSGNAFAFVAAYQLRLIGTTRIVVCGCSYLALSFATCTAVIIAQVASALLLSLLVLGLLATLCLLPFTALAATPLAAWWNRHR